MNLFQFSKTLSQSLQKNRSVFSLAFTMDKLVRQEDYINQSNKYNYYKNSKIEFNDYKYRKITIFQDEWIKTELIEWKYGSESPVEDKNTKNCIFFLFEGQLKESKYSRVDNQFCYARILQPHLIYYNDNYSYSTCLSNKSNESTFTLHLFPQTQSKCM